MKNKEGRWEMVSTFIVDADKCTACQLCVIACKDEHVGRGYAPWSAPQPDTGQFWIRIESKERGRIPRVRVTHLPIHCQHCAEAPCIPACSQGAIKRRDDGLVWIDPALCNGCGDCQKACPYDVIYLNQDLKIAQKCTGCAHRVDEGLLPRCADICPHEAIVFTGGSAAGAAQRAEPLEVYHPEFMTEPTVYWRGLPKPWVAGLLIDAARDEVIAGATVTATDLIGSESVGAQSDEFGEFRIQGLASGREYSLDITIPGYQPIRAVITANGDQDLGEVRLEAATARF
jgi:Fe-S-cluster-containing dehydrogenase component